MYYDSSADYYGRHNKLNKIGNDEYQKDNDASPHNLQKFLEYAKSAE